MADFKTNVAQAVRFYRKLKGFTQASLAAAIKMNPRHYQDIEAAKVDLKLSTISSIAKSMDIPSCFLLESTADHRLNDLHLGCPVTILDMIPIGVQICDLNGIMKYVNRQHADTIGLPKTQIVNKMHIWDVLYDQKEVPKLKEYLAYLVKEQPPAVPFLTKNLRNGVSVPVRVEWNYLRNSLGKLVGFISLINILPDPMVVD